MTKNSLRDVVLAAIISYLLFTQQLNTTALPAVLSTPQLAPRAPVIEPQPPVTAVPNFPNCAMTLQLPCSVQSIVFVAAGGSVGAPDSLMVTYGNLYPVHPLLQDGTINYDVTYMLKMQNKSRSNFMFGIEDEAMVTATLSNDISTQTYQQHLLESIPQISHEELKWNWAPTIDVYKSESYTNQMVQQIAIVMHHHPNGDVHHLSPAILELFRSDPSAYVWKFMMDMSYVLEIMNEKHGWIDGDVSLKNVVVSGNPNHYKTTSFIKIDYGTAMHKDNVRRQLGDYEGRKIGFCHFGSYTTPLDVRIMYGLTRREVYDWDQRLEKQTQQIVAARKLGYELESVDILDLSAAALDLYNKITHSPELEEHTILLWPYAARHDELARRELVEHNYAMLLQYYNNRVYMNPEEYPSTVRQLLIKMHWMALLQLPEYGDTGSVVTRA
eukprot:899927_1